MILAPVTYVIVVFIFAIRNLKPSDFLTPITEEIRKRAHTDASHVDELSQYKWQDLQYVLVEIKVQKGRHRKSRMARSCVGLVPGIIALVAALARFPEQSSHWILCFAFFILILYIIGIFAHGRMLKFDRAIMLLEMVIDTQKSKEGEPNESTKPFC